MAEPADPRPSLRWLTASLEHFVPGPASIEARGLTKRCTELALTAAYLRAWVRDGSLPAEPFADGLDAWQLALRRRCEDPAHRRDALEDPQAALFAAQPYLWMRCGGYRVETWEHELAGLSKSGVRPTSMGLLHCLWKAALLRREPDWDRALARWLSAWGERPRKRDAYRVTHAAFYVTDFGNQAAPVREHDRDRLVDLAGRLLDRSVARRRWDLTGELLTALTCLGREDGHHRDAARAFGAARPATANSGHDEQDFRHRYHTALVDVLRCASTARHAGRVAAGAAA